MKVQGKDYRTIWMEGSTVSMIDQCLLPFDFRIYRAPSFRDTCMAIREMIVRGAGAIGAAGGYAMAQACLEAPSPGYEEFLDQARKEIESTRPTARDLFFTVAQVHRAGLRSSGEAVKIARELADKNAEDGKLIGEAGQDLIADGHCILTHCNAGWLGLVDYGSALAPVYLAHRSGKRIMVYIDETRPRNQGARLTAWELQQEKVPCRIIADNAAAYLMSIGEIDLVIVGADRIAANGDVANKIGTLAVALAAHTFKIPFYVAAPTSTFDLQCHDGSAIAIEERDPGEVLFIQGYHHGSERIIQVQTSAPDCLAINPAFDITPARFIRGIITEKGVIQPNHSSIQQVCTS